MHRHTVQQLVAIVWIALASCCWSGHIAGAAATSTTTRSRRIQVYRARQSDSDLEVAGMISGLPDGATGYVRYADLLTLPQVRFTQKADDSFSELQPRQSVRITGVSLQDLAQALSVLRDSDLIDATCVDDYRGHYPGSYMTAHRPVLALTIDGLTAAAWATKHHEQSLGPYFIVYDHFQPAFKVLSHQDQPQLPTNIVRLHFTTTAATFGPLTPRGNFAADSPEALGFAIAKQNCLRCHNQGQSGGMKAGRNWFTLGTWAREQPTYFANYIHNPKAFDTKSKMPASLQYDPATLAAITAYFRTFPDAATTAATQQPGKE